MIRAISLFSGGLDSLLAIAVLKQQGIDVVALNFKTPFFGASTSNYTAAQQLEVPLYVLDIGDEYCSQLLRNPRYGYGKNMNPCIDCHGFMLKKAGDYMEQVGASFLCTGEVLGQRPMSQNKSALKTVEKLSTYADYIVRPLSAQLLDPTIPEKRGWIDRSRLLDLSGRSRVKQMQLAESFGIKEYPSPAGGCLLTDANFSRRLQHLMAHTDTLKPAALELLKVGRHFVLNEDTVLVVGRNHSENLKLEELLQPGDLRIKVSDFPGPSGLLRSDQPADQKLLHLTAGIVARYSDAKNNPHTTVKITAGDGSEPMLIKVAPLAPDQVPAFL